MKLKYKIVFTITSILAITSWLIALYYWDKLPAVIPVHFGLDGQTNGWADKSVWQVFLTPLIQTLISAIFIFVYFRPQYSNMPTTLWLATLDDKLKEKAFDMIRTTMSGTSILIGTLFTYLTYAMNISALNNSSGVSSVFMFVIMGLLFAWLIFWIIKMQKTIRGKILKPSNK